MWHKKLGSGIAMMLLVGGIPCSGSEWETELEKAVAQVDKKFPEVPQLSTKALAAWSDDASRKQPRLFDVRKEKEFAVSHLKDAVHLPPESDLKARFEKVDQGQPVVVYCSTGYRSSKLAEQLITMGHTNVFNLRGSIFAWANEGRPVYRGTNEVHRVHPYSRRWGRRLNPAYHPGSP